MGNMTEEWTHKKLVRRIATWVKNSRRAKVVVTELSTSASETPDVIAWWGGGGSLLVECKMSRKDFLADAKKWFRRCFEDGMGDTRYYAAPKGLLSPDELPPGWGLVEVDGRYVRVKKEAQSLPANKRVECSMLLSVLRRLQIATAVFVVTEEAVELDEEDGLVVTTTNEED